MLSVWQRYPKLLFSFFKASFVADLEYRANFLSRIVTDILWYVAQIVTFEALYLHTTTLGDWNVQQSRVFLGVLFVVDAVYMILFHDNVDRISEKVSRGELDLLLTKPMSSQFLLSCQRMATALIGNLILGSCWLLWAISQLPDFQWYRILWLFLLMPLGVVTLYCIRFIIATTAVIFTRADSINYVWYQLYRLGMRPDSIYAPWLRFVVLTVLPVGLVASLPSRFLLNGFDVGLFTGAIVVTGTFLYGSHRFWMFALKYYGSASS
jgi:ABC-2 type transport system permease protein